MVMLLFGFYLIGTMAPRSGITVPIRWFYVRYIAL